MLKGLLLSDRETGALCAMKEVEIFPDDPKSAECIKQLEQVFSAENITSLHSREE